jgi:acyl-CoA synthetase (AMP-forming)/AMP-acid ligase II
MYSKLLCNNNRLGSFYLNEVLAGFARYNSNSSNVAEKYVTRNTPKLVSPKYQKYSYAVSKTADLHLLCDTIGERLSTLAAEKPDHVAYKFCVTQTSLKFGEMKQRVDEMAQSLLSLGFTKGDRLAIMLPNVAELNLTLLAAASVGIIVVLMNPAYQLVEIQYMLKKTQSKGVVILDNLKTLKHYDILAKMCPELASTRAGAELNSKELPHLKHVILVSNRLMKDPSASYSGSLPYANIEKYASPQKHDIPHVDFDDTSVLLFTVSLNLSVYLKYRQVL